MKKLFQTLFPQVRSNEGSRFFFFMTLSLLISLAQTVGLILSESLLLSHYGPSALPLSFFVAAIATVAGSLLYAFGVNQAKNDLYFIRLLGGLALLVVLAIFLLKQGYNQTYYGLVCLYFLSQCVLLNHYWTFTGDFFDTLAAKRLFPLFVVGSSLGGMLGGILLSSTGRWMHPERQLLFWPLFLLTAMLLVRLTRRWLRRWGPLELEEADETSLTEMRIAANYLRQSNLGQQLVWSCACMILAAFLGQYIYSSIILENYPNPQDLTAFLSLLVTVTNLLEIVVEVAVTPWLIRTMGVANANQVHSALTFFSFLAVFIKPNLVTAVCLRCTRESLENAVAAPIRSLVYNALPARSRGRVRAFLEGFVTYAAMAAAGVLLWGVASADRPPAWMYWLGLASAAIYWLSNWAVQKSYLEALIHEVQAGRLHLDELSATFTSAEVQGLTRLWLELSQEARGHDPSLLRLTQTLGQRQIWAPLMEVAARPERPPWLRCACLKALGNPQWPVDWDLLQRCIQDPLSEIRLAALQAIPLARSGGQIPPWLEAICDDSSPEVRAFACQLLLQGNPLQGERARQQLLQMLAAQEVPVVVAALRRTPLSMVDEVLARCQHESNRIARAALLRLAHLPCQGEQQRPSWLKAARKGLQRRQTSVRRAALQLLNHHPYLLPENPEIWKELVGHLEEPSRATRELAISALAAYPLELGELLRPYLDSASPSTARAAIQCLSQNPRRESRETLHQILREQVHRLWICTLRVDSPNLPDCRPLQKDYLQLTLKNARERSRKLVFEVLAALETPRVIRSVEKVLRFANLRARADALEVLSNLGDRESAQLLVLLLEDGSLEDKRGDLPLPLLKQAEWEQFTGLNWLRSDPWLGAAVHWIAPYEGGQTPEEETVERLLVLRKVPLFAQMSLEQLVAIDERLEEVEYLSGEIVFEEGQLGAELYILLEGSVRILKSRGTENEFLLTRLEAVNYFGEMAILDDEPRSASVVVEGNSRLLVLKGEQLKDLVEQMPEMAFEIIKVLTARIRQADERLTQNKG